MANYCYSNFTFMVDNENKNELEKFYKIFSEIKDVIYFEEIAVKHNINTKEINCRGSIINVSELFGDNTCFEIVTETAWFPLSEFWDKLLELYENISYVYIAEEPGSELYINTDINGIVYSNRFKIVFVDYNMDILTKEFPNSKVNIQEIENGSEKYFNNISGLVDYVYKLSGISFSSFEEISTYMEDLSDNREDIYISVFEFEISL